MSRPAPEHRRTPRLEPFVVACTVVQGERRTKAFLTNLSPRGAQIACEEGVPGDGAEILVEVRLVRRGPLARLRGQVRWSKRKDAGRASFGVVFEEPSAEARRLVDSAIEEFRRRAELLS